MKIELTPCYILHHRDYRESSLLLDIFSKEHGRLNLIAKGAKRNKKQQHSTFNLYQKYSMSWILKSELGTLIDIENECNIPQLKDEVMISGFYINEILIRLLHKHEPHPELFNAYDNTIKSLANNERENTILRYFEKSLLESLGYGIVLDHDVETGEEITINKDYFYRIDHGPTLNKINSETSIRVSGSTLLQLRDEKLSDSKNINEAKILLKSILNQYLGKKPLYSRELYESYLQFKKVI